MIRIYKTFWIPDAVSVAKSVETEAEADTAFISDVENDGEDKEVEEAIY